MYLKSSLLLAFVLIPTMDVAGQTSAFSPQAPLFLKSRQSAEKLFPAIQVSHLQHDDMSDDSMSSNEEGDMENDREDGDKTNSNQRKPRFDPQTVQRGQAVFEDACTQCHDADRSLEKKKSLSGWLSTVKRMARMDGADINSSDFVPIATYLASLSAPSESDSDGEGTSGSGGDSASADSLLDEGFGSGLNVSGTISTQWRGGNDNLENPGFFVDSWVTADWQPSGPIRGRVTGCTSCHSDQTNDGGFTLELVEASATLDLLHWYKKRDKRPEHCKIKVEAELTAGRFVVPFGAFASMSHPGVYRTVTNPLMFNMGRQVNANRSFPPVLPGPFSDEGADLSFKIPVGKEIDATLDLYAVNGLVGSGTGVQFTPSRKYADNNDEPTLGGRATIGNNRLRFGGSIMSGRMNDQLTPSLQYKLTGADVTARFCEDLIRVYFEYAIRTNDTVFGEDQIAYGIVSEAEFLLLDDPNLNALVRYDTLEHRSFFGDTSIARFTWGLSTTSIGGTLLMINHEHWNFPTDDEPDIDVLGIRWVATF